jgi:hypothetical protein
VQLCLLRDYLDRRIIPNAHAVSPTDTIFSLANGTILLFRETTNLRVEESCRPTCCWRGARQRGLAEGLGASVRAAMPLAQYSMTSVDNQNVVIVNGIDLAYTPQQVIDRFMPSLSLGKIACWSVFRVSESIVLLFEMCILGLEMEYCATTCCKVYLCRILITMEKGLGRQWQSLEDFLTSTGVATTRKIKPIEWVGAVKGIIGFGI